MSITPVIPCELLPETRDRIRKFADDLRAGAHAIGTHGLTADEFVASGIFEAAVERLRGQRAASTTDKYAFVTEVLQHLKENGLIEDFEFQGSGERHDFEVRFVDGYVAAIETKGCLDGNNTNIFLRPPSADEFVIWSLCQNAGADPRHNAWSGIHTRLGAEVIHRRELVDAVIIWDALCGTVGRPCPKVVADKSRTTSLSNGHQVPPPCIYLLPATVPDARNNPSPRITVLEDSRFVRALCRAFKGSESDVTSVGIEVKMIDATVYRRTTFTRNGGVLAQSTWVPLKRVR